MFKKNKRSFLCAKKTLVYSDTLKKILYLRIFLIPQQQHHDANAKKVICSLKIPSFVVLFEEIYNNFVLFLVVLYSLYIYKPMMHFLDKKQTTLLRDCKKNFSKLRNFCSFCLYVYVCTSCRFGKCDYFDTTTAILRLWVLFALFTRSSQFRKSDFSGFKIKKVNSIKFGFNKTSIMKS